MTLRAFRASVVFSGILAISGLAGFGTARADSEHGSLTLSEAYRLALRTSEQVKIAEGNRDLADTTYTDQLTIMGPTITASARGQYQNNARGQAVPGLPANQGLQPPYAGAALVQVAQPLFRRQIFDARRQAKYGIESLEESLVRARQQLMFDTATLFIAVLQAREQVVVAQGALSRAEQSLQSTNLRFKAGALLPRDVLLAQIEVNRAQTSVATADGARLQQESQFERLIGRRPPDVLVLPPTPAREAIADALEKAPEDRADLRALRYAALQARAQVSYLQAKIFWPTLDLTFTGGYVVQASSDGVHDFRYPTYGATGILTIPFFQTGDEFLQVKLQKERAFMAAYQESFLRRQVGDDVRRAVARLETADKNIQIAGEQRKNAEKNYQAVAFQLKIGQANEIDMVTAQAALLEAESGLTNAQYEREIATYQLLFAEGKIHL